MTQSQPRVEWFFDVVSPFAYLQLEQLPLWLPPEQLVLRPVVLGALLGHWGTRGPAEIPAKRVQTYRSAQWRAQLLGIAFRMPPAHPFNPIRLLRLAVALGSELDAVREILRFVWREGRDPASETDWQWLTRERLACPEAEQLIARDEVKAALRENTDQAIARGVFGVPTLVMDSELFWGEDAGAMARRTFEQGPQWLRQAEWQRIATLPVGVQRAA
ncbi:2-hydroxychromene-2-carboxylate isomerase [Polaromonas sp.]|uniref:2-hydroxychromene-2-carboxylate isomerase n=1 Tax=Polaromonas sp. TaxID=1869339 RepID=UPI002FC8BEA5